MATAPLVMPEVITGLSLLLLFVAMEQIIGWPEGRGITTITIAHMTFSMAYVTVVVQSRLATLDESLEEAAMDLGARPAKVFFLITLPIILPAILAGWLLAFTLSWDDLVITSFVDGAGLEHAADRDLLEGAASASARTSTRSRRSWCSSSRSALPRLGIYMQRQQKRRDLDVQRAVAANE